MLGTRNRRLLLLAAAVAAIAAPGCTRQFFRERADKDVAGLLTQKNIFPEWVIKSWHVYPNPDARFADPSRPDRPPYPPDDFAARMLSPNPQKPGHHAGAGRIEGEGYLARLAQWDSENRALEQSAERLPPAKPAAPQGVGMYPRQVRDANAVAGNAKGPTIAESREPKGVVLAVGEMEQNGKVVPVVALIPAEQPPTTLPEIPDAGPPKRSGEPGQFPAKGEGQPVPKDLPKDDGGPVAMVLTGDAAASYLNALKGNDAGFRIKLDQAVELGVVNSREFQDRREDLYLAALPVTLQRYNFAAQAFLAETIVRQNLGGEFPGGPRNNWQFGTDASLAKLFPTGAALLVRVANQFVVDLSSDRPNVAVSNFSLSVVQPFLRGGGYAVTLEPLTNSERNLVYAIRSYARFRKLYYVAVASGGGYTNNPYGLAGLSVNLGRGIGGNLTAPSVGYLQLLLQRAVIANQTKNVASLEELLRLYQAFREGGQQSDLQVMQVESQLLSSRGQLLGSSNSGGGGSGIRGYLDALDNFKLQLGLPLTVGLELDKSPLGPIYQQLGRFEEVYRDVRLVEEEARKFDPAEPVDKFRERWRTLLSQSALVKGTDFSKSVGPAWAELEKLSNDELLQRNANVLQQRRELLDKKTERQLKGEPEPPDAVQLHDALNDQLDLILFEQAVRTYLAQPWRKEPTPTGKASVQAGAFRDVFNAFYQLILEARNERLTQIRQMWPKLPPVLVEGADLLDLPLDDAYTTGIQTALSHRLDLMNARGQVVDAWRQIKVQANSLQGVFDVRYDLNSVTPAGGTNPAAFSSPRSSNELTINAELPLVRRAERNNYRAALIAYQRQRRTLMSFEDNIANDVRADIRELRTIAELYKIQQRLIELGYAQVDNAQAILLAPPAAGAQTGAGDAAALTNQVLQAQSSLLQAQNTLFTIWVNYLTSRMTLYLDLEQMQVDERGVWNDELNPGNEFLQPGPEPAREPGRTPAFPGSERIPVAPRPAPGRDR